MSWRYGSLLIDTSIMICAPMDVVWATLTDYASYVGWNPYIIRIDGAATADPVIHVWTDESAGGLDYDVTVLALTAPTRMVWAGTDNDPAVFDGTHVWDLTPVRAGTLVRQHEQFRGANAPAVLNKFGEGILHNFERFNEALRTEAERRFTTKP
jgi:hypothetical protein